MPLQATPESAPRRIAIACIGELRHCVLAYFLLAAAVPESNETNRTMEQA